MAGRALEAAVARVNSVYATRYLYRPTQGSMTRVSPERFYPPLQKKNHPLDQSSKKNPNPAPQVMQTGPDTVDLLLAFTIKETQCAKGSAPDLQGCVFRPGYFVVRLCQG